MFTAGFTVVDGLRFVVEINPDAGAEALIYLKLDGS